MLPKLYVIAHPKTPYRVIFIDPSGNRILRHFKDKTKAHAYHRELLAKASIGGTAGLVMDAEMRAEYFGARQALGGVPVMTAVRFYLRHRPTGLAATLLPDVLAVFLQDKRRSGRAVRTVESLKSAVELFLAASEARMASDYTRDALTRYLDGLNAHPLTLRTHRARLSAFGEWMAKREYIPENPTRYIDVGSYDPRPPRVFTPQEAETVMARAAPATVTGVASSLGSGFVPAPSNSTASAASTQSEIWPVGYVVRNQRVNVFMSDGTARTEKDSDLSNVNRNSITLSGKKMYMRPRSFVSAPSATVTASPVAPSGGFQLDRDKPASPAPIDSIHAWDPESRSWVLKNPPTLGVISSSR